MSVVLLGACEKINIKIMHFFFNLLGVSRLKSKFHHQTTYPSARTLWSQTQIDKFYFQTVSDPKVRFLKKSMVSP